MKLELESVNEKLEKKFQQFISPGVASVWGPVKIDRFHMWSTSFEAQPISHLILGASVFGVLGVKFVLMRE